MKKLILTISLLVNTSSTLAFTWNQSFRVNANCYANRKQGKCLIENYWTKPIFCSGRVGGRTYTGKQYTSSFNNLLIRPGRYAYAYVFAYGFEDLEVVGSTITCKFSY